MAPCPLEAVRDAGDRDAIVRAGLPLEVGIDGLGVRTAPNSSYQPEAVVFPKGLIGGDDRHAPEPVVVVEVLSPSSEARDRGEKFAAYKQLPSLREYVLVAQEERSVEIRRRGEHGWSSEMFGAGEAFLLHGREVRVDAIYR